MIRFYGEANWAANSFGIRRACRGAPSATRKERDDHKDAAKGTERGRIAERSVEGDRGQLPDRPSTGQRAGLLRQQSRDAAAILRLQIGEEASQEAVAETLEIAHYFTSHNANLRTYIQWEI